MRGVCGCNVDGDFDPGVEVDEDVVLVDLDLADEKAEKLLPLRGVEMLVALVEGPQGRPHGVQVDLLGLRHFQFSCCVVKGMFDLGFPFLQGMKFLLRGPTRLNPGSENLLEEALSGVAGLLEVAAEVLDASDHWHPVVLAEPACMVESPVEGFVVVGGVFDGFEDRVFEHLRRDLLHGATVPRAFVEAGAAVVEVPAAVSIAARRGQVESARASKSARQEEVIVCLPRSLSALAFAVRVDHLPHAVEHKMVDDGFVFTGGDDFTFVDDVTEEDPIPQHVADYGVGELASALLALPAGVVPTLAVPVLVEPRGDAVD
ncbi:MAG: hypothetical protein V3V08_07115 [Nannocystaceae bacterium]